MIQSPNTLLHLETFKAVTLTLIKEMREQILNFLCKISKKKRYIVLYIGLCSQVTRYLNQYIQHLSLSSPGLAFKKKNKKTKKTKNKPSKFLFCSVSQEKQHIVFPISSFSGSVILYLILNFTWSRGSFSGNCSLHLMRYNSFCTCNILPFFVPVEI